MLKITIYFDDHPASNLMPNTARKLVENGMAYKKKIYQN